ncbi:hypothetical protein VOLCADRAFT_94226 [Volvox carteri f. nagariensis]|uniref:Uncharacterized protein n=1 Tax=Volvox carteri f. nagariensis TaxID=3068 RepID=D8U4G8_VOLCA|nr:uncharacterized protein VOLCADRAFT_94226 [Volvox carteri f. nagariensis]EFJ45500.1 hypothetical protein VOLCADRAFT_94226 [Volvox carteri f. nagariensis]|eukprot:XP_002953527.1 hypothetical protein VOLCADRAFT_94226 [Volvox carteri f. nagariensis]
MSTGSGSQRHINPDYDGRGRGGGCNVLPRWGEARSSAALPKAPAEHSPDGYEPGPPGPSGAATSRLPRHAVMCHGGSGSRPRPLPLLVGQRNIMRPDGRTGRPSLTSSASASELITTNAKPLDSPDMG